MPEPNPTGSDVVESPLSRPGSVMTLLIEHYSGAVLGNDSLAGGAHTVTNMFDAELTQQADGKWTGPANATSTGDSKVVFLTEECTTSWDGTQTFDLTGEFGTFAAGNNFGVLFVPTSSPDYTTAPDTECDHPNQHPNGFDFMPYHDSAITDGGFVEMKVAPPPGGEAVYEDELNEIVVVSFSWTTISDYD
ncbi:MAG TPA: hypothetical protein VEX62_12460 [Candidatus Limnocylindrales bacterium]|nr:hypothetical protein [Candidatus Limnocylindrales bacterium]